MAASLAAAALLAGAAACAADSSPGFGLLPGWERVEDADTPLVFQHPALEPGTRAFQKRKTSDYRQDLGHWISADASARGLLLLTRIDQWSGLVFSDVHLPDGASVLRDLGIKDARPSATHAASNHIGPATVWPFIATDGAECVLFRQFQRGTMRGTAELIGTSGRPLGTVRLVGFFCGPGAGSEQATDVVLRSVGIRGISVPRGAAEARRAAASDEPAPAARGAGTRAGDR